MNDEELFGLSEQEKVIKTYFTKGFLKSKQDADELHQAYSPQRVPNGLTKLQIRRKINKFVKNGRVLTNPFENSHRLTITVDGKFILGITFVGNVPDNSKELNKLLKTIVKISNLKDVPDPEVLGKHSP